jgi:hypothetical protein
MMRICIRLGRCRGRHQLLTDDNFRQHLGSNDYYNICNFCRQTTAWPATPRSDDFELQMFCSDCNTWKDSLQFMNLEGSLGS